MKKIIALILVFSMLFTTRVCGVTNTELQLESKSSVLMEASTKTVILSNNKDERLSPASITKIMTLILIFDAIHSGKMKLTDMVTTSAYAKSMGGSQVFLEEGEQQSVETMIKCIIIASGNDASVAMAEHIAGSEEAFVAMMNERAKGLGMKNTNFVDCCGLTDSDAHYTSAYDVALMSRELVVKYPEIYKYSTIWMESIIHKTNKGESEFVLSNTNKLLKTNKYVKGLKTGSTSKAKYCVSTVAEKDKITLISVVMAAPDYKVRFSESEKMIHYGFSNCKVYEDEKGFQKKIRVINGKKDYANALAEKFSYVDTKGSNLNNIKSKVNVYESINAPVKKGDKVGEISYSLDGKIIGKANIVLTEDTKKTNYSFVLKRMLMMLFQIA